MTATPAQPSQGTLHAGRPSWRTLATQMQEQPPTCRSRTVPSRDTCPDGRMRLLLTLCNSSLSGAAAQAAEDLRDAGTMLIKTRAIQIWGFCVPASRYGLWSLAFLP